MLFLCFINLLAAQRYSVEFIAATTFCQKIQPQFNQIAQKHNLKAKELASIVFPECRRLKPSFGQ